jgi:hypothetical protein
MAVDIDGVNSTISTNKLIPQSGTALQIGDASDVITIPASATITNLGTATGFGGGKVLQVVHTRWNGVSSTASTTYTATPLISFQRTITPSATSSNILIMVVLNFCTNNNTDHTYLKMYRDSTQINMGDQLGSGRDRATWNQKMGSNLGNLNPEPMLYYDTEISTTSEVTYSFQVKVASLMTAYFNQDNTGNDNANYITTSSSIVCMEIGA